MYEQSLKVHAHAESQAVVSTQQDKIVANYHCLSTF